VSAPADWLITGARIWTGVPGDPTHDALAIRGGRIAAVGRVADLEGLRGRRTAVLHLEGRCIVPGFVDAHVHLQAGGLQLFRVDLRRADSAEAFIRQVADQARVTPGGGWILGGDWDHKLWGGELPVRSWLDRAAPGRPVILHRIDMHMAVASSAALELAGIDSETPDPESGLIDRAPDTGEPTGILRERALEPVWRVVPLPTLEERRSALRAAVRYALERGVTQLHDMGAMQDPQESWRSLHALRALRHEGFLPIRVSAAVPFSERGELLRFIEEEGRGDARLRWGMVKGFVDGSLGSSTAWFHEPYLGQEENRGTVVTDLEELEEDIRASARSGLQPAVHAIGDRAVDWLLGVYEKVAADAAQRGVDPGSVRPRVEHAQHMTPAALGRAARVGAIYSVQPAHLVEDGRWAGDALGPDREKRSYPFRSLLGEGCTLAFGSDWTVTPIDPIGALHAAVTRRVWDPARGEWGGVWGSEERISLEEALRAHTLGGARAALMDGETGTLEAGKRADLAVLTADPFQVDPEALRELVQVEMTFVDGVLAHRAEELELGALQ
jgi:predicted amidohydrolase YtcJ